ncbi:acyltransferase [Yasminevirus sp. GU-2018]|uniref:Acyltransferase n=1 Tax=Yasminevirus sp. GU-2018 TaxID=2420051 RepID=A0A5K0U8W5_9VIRU|nr:acyltransferase [Yasminevirus sp. GU-2018]
MSDNPVATPTTTKDKTKDPEQKKGDEYVLDKGKKVSNLSVGTFLATLLSPVTLLTIPMFQRINYWINVNMLDDYDTYKSNHELMAPLVLNPISSLGSLSYHPILHFDGVTEKEFAKDVHDTQVVIGNHVGYTDFLILMQIAIHYGVESNIVAYFMKSLTKWPVLGPTLWAQIPLARDGSKKDLEKLNSRLDLYANSDSSHLFALFPEGGLPYNPKLHERTLKKCEEYGTALKYMNFPKTSGLSHLIRKVGHKIRYVYTFVLVYTPKSSKVHVIVKRICKVSEVPKEPTSEYVTKHKLTINEDNRLFYAHEEFLLDWTEKTDRFLEKYYQSFPEDERPTVVNTLKKKFPEAEAEEEDSDGS